MRAQRRLVDRAGVVIEPAHHAEIDRERRVRHAELAYRIRHFAELVQPLRVRLVAVGEIGEQRERLGALAARRNDAVELGGGLRRHALAAELAEDRLLGLLGGLVERAQHVACPGLRHLEVLQDALQQLAVVDADAELADRHFPEDCVDDARDLGLEEIRQRVATDDVDVALIELAEAPALHLGVLAAPHALDLVAAEGKGELALAHRDVAGERHREVEAQRPLGRRFVVLLRGQARKRVDLLLGAAFRGEHLDPLGRGRLDRQEAVALEVAPDEIEERVELQLVLRQKLLVKALQQGRAYFSHGRGRCGAQAALAPYVSRT